MQNIERELENRPELMEIFETLLTLDPEEQKTAVASMREILSK